MYTIMHDGRVLFDPTSGAYIEAPVLSMEANKLASLTFTVYPDNPEFSRITTKNSVLSVYRDGELMMQLRPMYRKLTFAGGVSYKCEEMAAVLDDVLHRPDYFNGTVSAYMTRMINAYNDIADVPVTLGSVSFQANHTEEFVNDDYEGFFEGLKSHLVDAYGGYLLPHYTSNGIVLDYVSDTDLPSCGQAIKFSENMADMFIETEASEMYTVLIPLGKDVKVSNAHSSQSKQRPQTIDSVNSGKDYLENAAGIALYGRREKTQRWKSATDATDLKSKGEAYLANHAAQLKDSITLSAVDLHYLDVDTDAIEWMTRVDVVSEPHGMDSTYTVTKVDLNLGNPEPISLQLGEPTEVFTDKAPKNSTSRRSSKSSGSSSGSSGSGGGQAASSEEVTSWQMIVKENTDLLFNSGIQEIAESGIILDTSSGVRLYNMKEILVGGLQTAGLKGMIDVQSSRISLVVEGEGALAHIKPAAIVAAINAQTGSSSVKISADQIILDGDTLSNQFTAVNAYFTGGAEATSIKTVSATVVALSAGTINGKVIQWKSQSVVTGVSITDASVTYGNERYYLYSSGSSSTEPAGAASGRLLYSRTNGSHSVSTDTIYYLGYTS